MINFTFNDQINYNSFILMQKKLFWYLKGWKIEWKKKKIAHKHTLSFHFMVCVKKILTYLLKNLYFWYFWKGRVYTRHTLIRIDKEFSSNWEKKIIGRSFLFDNYMRERIFSFITKSTNGTDFFFVKKFPPLYPPKKYNESKTSHLLLLVAN